MQYVRVKTGLAVALLWSAMPASAQQTLDQSYYASSPTAVLVSREQSFAQTFTVGRSERLYSIYAQVARDLISVPSLDLVMELRTTLEDGRPSDNVLATGNITPDSVPTWTDSAFVGIDLTYASLDVKAGDKLAIVLRTEEPVTGQGFNPYAWFGNAPGGYEQGSAFIQREGAEFSSIPFSFGFRSYTTSVVPAPGALMTALIGVMPGTALLLRRRRS